MEHGEPTESGIKILFDPVGVEPASESTQAQLNPAATNANKPESRNVLNGTQQIYPDNASAARAAGDAFLAALEKHDLKKHGLFNVALSGGSTPNTIYDYLAALPANRRVRELALKARFFWSDERTVPPTHADSNFGAAWSRLLGKLDLPALQVHRLAGEQIPSLAALNYERLISAFAPAASAAGGRGTKPSLKSCTPAFDLIFLGMGPDGHTASLFPGTAALQEKERIIVANQVSQQNTMRLTFTFPLINAARAVWILATGESKASALAGVSEAGGKFNPLYPISGVSPRPTSRLTWYLDKPAAARLA